MNIAVNITLTFILFLPFTHSCWSSCPSEYEKICNEDWISLVKVINSNRNEVDSNRENYIRYTLQHLYVFKALSDERQLPIFLDADSVTSAHPKLLDVGKTYILSGPKATDPLKIYACTSITRLVDNVSKDGLVQKLTKITPKECVTMFDEAEK